MVEFLKDVKATDFTFEKGKRYVSISESDIYELTNSILIRQPNSPKKVNWWAEFPKSYESNFFRILSKEEMTYDEIAEENRLLQL